MENKGVYVRRRFYNNYLTDTIFVRPHQPLQTWILSGAFKEACNRWLSRAKSTIFWSNAE
jgi:hypothetical protein